ncbi:MAG: L-threonylcarbamoyladenylate synthase [Burkholderiaceae bacterium]
MSGARGACVRAADTESIALAARLLAGGEAVALPTETVYGLGADAASARAVAEIYRIKGRPADHPLIVHVLGLDDAHWWGEIGDDARRLIDAFWPGPLTLIVRRRSGAPSFASAGQDTVGLRAPAHPVARALLEAFAALGGHGIAAPSANRFGRVSPTRAEHVADDLDGDVALILDGGPCDVGVESTIVDVSRGTPVLMRPGGVDETRLAEVLGRVPAPRDALAPRASGTLAAHYAPRTPLEIVAGGEARERVERCAREGLRVALWSAREPHPRPAALVHWEPAPDDPRRYARALYGTLRALDRLGADRLLVEAPPPGPRWDAVRDRLARAAAAFEERK